MKLLWSPINVPGSEQIGMQRGFSQVFTSFEIDFLSDEAMYGKQGANDKLIATIAEFKPNIWWYQRQETTTYTPNTIKYIHETYPEMMMTTWSGDARDYVPPTLAEVLPYFDIFYNDTDQYKMYKPHLKGCKYEFMPIAVDPEEVTNFSHIIQNVRDVVFIGNNYPGVFSNTQFRYDLMVALSREFGSRFGVYGSGWDSNVEIMQPTPVKHQSSYYNQARVVISVDHVKGILHWSERLPWALASTTPVVCQRQPGIEKWFPSPYYFDTIPEAIKLVHKLLDELPIVDIDAQKNILENHCWAKRAEQIKENYDRH